MEPNTVLEALREAADAVRSALDSFNGAGLSGRRHGQYELDLVADDAACDVLFSAGLAVFSEESGHRGTSSITVVIDPVDGSTNTDRGIPFSCTSLCAIDAEGPVASLVRSLTTGVTYEAIRGEGATRDGAAITPSTTERSSDAIVGVNGVLEGHPGWSQVRTLGAAALEICLVADGALDAYTQVGGAAIHPWDYLAGLHIVREAGGYVMSLDGAELEIMVAEPRQPLVAGTEALARQIAEQLKATAG
jgi:fructose-1,6-bisphosphatase/inositol monophosphatase family enzyme